MKEIIATQGLVKNYYRNHNSNHPEARIEVLKGLDLSILEGEYVCIMGSSGGGKTTLLKILGMMESITDGEYYFQGKDASKLWKDELADIRRKKIGFVFQDYNLLDTMTLEDNIALPLSLNGVSGKVCMEKTGELCRIFGLSEHRKKYPYQLSGGQKQRGAACRALITDPEIIFADEPTGALDSRSGKELLESLKKVNDSGRATILMVTHDAFSASYAKDVYILSDGQIQCRISKGADRKEFYDRIIDMQSSMGGDFS